MRIIYCGSRHWNDPHAVYAVVEDLQHRFPDHVAVHGDQRSADGRGADHMVDCIAKRLGLETEPHPADWKTLGRKAGPLRNFEMLDAGADLVVAFKEYHEMDFDLRKGGTEHMMKIALKRDVPAIHFPSCTTWRLSEPGAITMTEEASLLALMERAALL